MATKEDILNVLRSKGPLVPNDIRRTLGESDSMILGAMLSELTTRGMVKISHMKKGGSPFYYLPGQERFLERFVEFLNPKDQKTLQELKSRKVMFDKSQELLIRVSLRQIRDFAIPFELTTSQGSRLFWRYFLVSEQEAVSLVHQPVKKVEAPAPIVEEKKVDKKKEQMPLGDKPPTTQQRSEPKPKQAEGQQASLPATPSLEKTPFYETILDYFNKSNIVVLNEEMISKNRDYDFIVEVPSGVGNLKMVCKARNKKKLNEGDVAPALLKAKKKDLPCLFLTNGEFTKKSLGIIDKEYKGIVIKQI